MRFGYARTSTTDQAGGLAAQERDLKSSGVERVFTEQASCLTNRPVLKACLAFLRENDQLVVTQPDRLARSVTDLLAIRDDLERRGIGLVVLSMGALSLDTRFPDNKLTLTILAGIAEWERAIMFERQRGGVSKAKAEGRYTGRPRSINPDDVRALIATMSITKIARKLKISRSSAYRMLQQAPPIP
jgi:DNA invertase Pin-like site-specific DNA recombinase